jgi:hypothetical protein
MSVLNQPTLRNKPEDGRIQFNRGGNLRSRPVRYEDLFCVFRAICGITLTGSTIELIPLF